MEYDGNDTQGHNLKVAGEDRSKSPSVLRRYDFPRFDIDDSIQGHLRFDNLVETDVFLGIQSQGDNQWIEDFSRESDVIEFSSSATESSSIARKNNVWSEATSSESVEMLLKSVGQEQIPPKDTVCENSNNLNELGSLVKDMEPKFEQDNVNGGSTSITNAIMLQDDLLNSFSALDNCAEGKLCQAVEISLSEENVVEQHGSSCQTQPNDLDEECKLPVPEVLFPGTESDDNNGQGGECSVDVCLDQTGEGLSHSAEDIKSSSSIQVSTQSADQICSHSEGTDALIRATDDGIKVQLVSEEIANLDTQIIQQKKLEDAMHIEVPYSFSSSVEECVDEQTDVEVIINTNDSSMMSCAQEGQFQLLEGKGGDNSLTSPILPDRCQTDVLSTSRVIIAASTGSDSLTDNSEQQHASKLITLNAEHCSSSGANMDLVEESDQKLSDKVDNMTENSNGEGEPGNEVLVSSCQSSLIEGENNPSTDEIVNANIGDLGESLGCPVSSSSVWLTRETDGAESIENLHEASAVNVEGSRSSVCREDFQVEADSQSNARETGDISTEIKKQENISLSTTAVDVSPRTCGAPTSDQGPPSLVRNMNHNEPVVNQPHSENAREMEAEANVILCKKNNIVEGKHEDIHKQPIVRELPGSDDNERNHAGMSPNVTFSNLDGSHLVAVEVGSACKSKSGIHLDSTASQFSGTDGKLNPVMETCNVATGSESPTVKSGDCSKRPEVHPVCDDSVLNKDSPTIISSVVLPSDESKQEADGASEFADNKLSASEDFKGKYTPLDDNSFTFKVNLPPNVEREKANTWAPFPIAETYKSSVVTEGVATPDTDKIHARLPQETSSNNPEDHTYGMSKATSGCKRRASGKGVAKENVQKGTNMKETTPDMSSHKDDTFSVSFSPVSLPGQFTGSQPHGITKPKSRKLSTKNAVPTSNLPDLNASALKNLASPSTSFQQPFTELQQVQLRAQIFVYGSIIQGTAPDEACMVSAFGSSDRGRSVWEPVWQSFMERIRSKKSRLGSESPMNSHSSGVKVPDVAGKQVSLETKVFPSPVSQAGRKGTATTILSPTRPLSSPLWSNSTPYNDVSQSSNLQRRPALHYQPAISPLQPYKTPPAQNIIGQTTRQSQAPSPTPWALQNSVNVNARFSTTAITETVKLTPVKGFSLPAPSSVKDVSSPALVYTDTTSTEFARSSQLPDQTKGSFSSDMPSANSKPKRRKKPQPSNNTPQNPLLSQAQTEMITVSSLPTITSPLTLVTSPTGHVTTSMIEAFPACSTSQPQAGTLDSGKASAPSSVKDAPSPPPLVYTDTTSTEFARSSQLPDQTKGSLSSEMPSANSKPRRRKKPQPSNNTPQNPLLSQAQAERTITFSLPTLTSPHALVKSPTYRVTTSMRDVFPAFSTSQLQAGTSPFSVQGAPSPPLVHFNATSAVFSKSFQLPDQTLGSLSPEVPSTDSKPRRRKKTQPYNNSPQNPFLSQGQTETTVASSLPTLASPLTLVTSPSCHVTTSMRDGFLSCSTSQAQVDNFDSGKASAFSEETLQKVEDAKLQADEAAILSATAISHCKILWSQLAKQDSRMTREAEAQIASAAGAAAAAASVAKAAAAAARVASNAALQAKLMADEAFILTATGNVSQSGNSVSTLHSLGSATSVPILTADCGTNQSSSIFVVSKEAANSRIQAASAAVKRSENLNSVLEAVKLAAEAVSQAGKIVAMGEPLPLKELISAGPEGYWRKTPSSPELSLKSGDGNQEQNNKGSAQGGVISTKDNGGPSVGQISDHGRILPEKPSNDSSDNNGRSAGGISESIGAGKEDPGVSMSHKISDVVQSNNIRGLSAIGNNSGTGNVQNELEFGTVHGNNIREGSVVEVYKDGDGFKPAWFSANVLTLHDGKAFVRHRNLWSKEGHENLKEWVALEGEGDKAPRIRTALPMNASHWQGTRKRRRSAIGNYAWFVGDMVDAWIQDSWCEGVVTEKNENDETTLTVHFPARGETSAVSAQQLRPSRSWNDGNWIQRSRLRGHDSSNESDVPLEKRPRLKSPFGKNKSEGEELVVGKLEESKLEALSASDMVFNVGKSTKEETKPDTRRTLRTGLQREGSRVVFGVPKPGKKRRFVEVSKHFPAAQNVKGKDSKDQVKFAKYLMPQGTGRGGKNFSKVDSKDKQSLRPTPLKSRSSSRTMPQRGNLVNSASSQHDKTLSLPGSDIEKSVVHDEHTSKTTALTERGFSGTFEARKRPPGRSFKKSLLSTKPNVLNKGKSVLAGGKLSKVDEEEVPNDRSDSGEVSEPRRSNRRVQPTHRLLEGLQSSLIIPKMPSVSQDKGQGQKSHGTSAFSRGK